MPEKLQCIVVTSCICVLFGAQCGGKTWAQSATMKPITLQHNVEKQLQEKARTLAASANAFYTKAEFKPAEPIVRELLDVLKQIPGYADNSIAQAIAHRADLYYYGNSELCIPLYQQELKMRDVLNWQQFKDRDEQFKIICERNRLAITYSNLKDYSAAEPIFKRTLSEFRTWGGGKEIDDTTVSVAAFYAQCLRQLGKSKEADALQTKVNEYNRLHPPRGLD
jgi:hypothetical protein